MAGKQVCYETKMSILEAETVGAQDALQWIGDLGIRNVVVESDLLTVVNVLLRDTEYVSEVGITSSFLRVADCPLSKGTK